MNAAALADAVAEALRESPSAPGATDTIVVPSAGFGRWLNMALADRLGIAAGLEIVTPAGFFASLVPADRRWSRGRLTWAIFAALPHVDEAPEASGRARWVLASTIARTFDRYANWRPKLVRDWISGAGEGWQPALFRVVVEQTQMVLPGDNEPPLGRVFYCTALTPAQSLGAQKTPGQTFELQAGDAVAAHVLAAPGALRQVEGLRDFLRIRLASDPTLNLRDILVLTPDPARYGPLVRATFSDDTAAMALAVDVADGAMRVVNPAAAAFVAVLKLIGGRYRARDVLAVLDRVPVGDRFGLPERQIVRDWVDRAGIAWGLDADHLVRCGLPSDADNTWRTGLDRLLLGQAMGPVDDLVLGVAVDEGVEGGTGRAALGGLAEFYAATLELERVLAGDKSPADWVSALLVAVDAVLDTPDDPGQLQSLRDALTEAFAGAPDVPIGLETVRGVVEHALLEGGPGRRFLAGGVNVCSPATGRAVPARIVCVLGLEDARNDPRPSFDLMRHDVRPGDPEPGNLALLADAMAAASDCLIVTYSALEPTDGRPRPQPVALAQLQAEVHHHSVPLQPFCPAQFGEDPSAIETALLAGARALQRPARGVPPFVSGPLALDATGELELDTLTRYFAAPTKQWVFRTLGVWLDEGVDEAPETPPLALGGLGRWALEDRLLKLGLKGHPLGTDSAAARSLRRSGQLPPGAPGDLLLTQIMERVGPLVSEAMSLDYAAAGPVDVNAIFGGERLVGRLPRFGPQGVVLAHPSWTKGKHLLPRWIEHLALSATEGVDWNGYTHIVGRPRTMRFGPIEADVARVHLGELTALYRAGQALPLMLFPETSFKYAKGLGRGRDNALKEARRAWAPFGVDRFDALLLGDHPPYETPLPGALSQGPSFHDLAETVCGPIVRALVS